MFSIRERKDSVDTVQKAAYSPAKDEPKIKSIPVGRLVHSLSIRISFPSK